MLVQAVSGSSEASGESTFLKQGLYKYRSSYKQGPKEVQQPAKPSWKLYFEAFIARSNPEVTLGHYIML